MQMPSNQNSLTNLPKMEINHPMKQIGILFQPEMVRANVAGRKWMTRRLRALQPINSDPDRWHLWQPKVSEETGEWAWSTNPLQGEKGEIVHIKCPYGKAGDVMWQRETWQPIWATEKRPPNGFKSPEGWNIGYPATDGVQEFIDMNTDSMSDACRPSIHMPRWASRFVRPITRIRCERVQSITEADAQAEGAPLNRWYRPVGKPEGDSYNLGAIGSTYNATWDRSCYRNGFASLWDSIHAENGHGWDRNPWVWVIEYAKQETVKA